MYFFLYQSIPLDIGWSQLNFCFFLPVGGLGKEWTTQDGTVLNFNPMFIKKISMHGEVEHLNWYDQYIKLRSRAGIEFPG